MSDSNVVDLEENVATLNSNLKFLENKSSILKGLAAFYEESMPFNQFLGIKVVEITPEGVSVRIDMKKDLVGNPVKNILHGGVFASLVDLAGGIAAGIGVINRYPEETDDQLFKRFGKMGTIDLRIDYLASGIGEYFIAKSSAVRTGRRIGVCRTDLFNNEGKLLAIGTSSYIVG